MASSEAISAVFNRHSEHRLQMEELMQMLPLVLPDPSTMSDSFDVSPLLAFLETVVNLETGSMVVSRQLVNAVIARLDGDPLEGVASALGAPTTPAPTNVAKTAYTRLVTILQSRAISYEEQMSTLNLKLANIFEHEGKLIEAANCLSNIPLESGQRQLSPAYKTELYLRIARLRLESGDAEKAEGALNRVSMIMQTDGAGRTNDDNTLQYKALSARVLDARRRFIEAAGRYHELACGGQLSGPDQLEALAKALTCTLLAQPGHSRTRLLTSLYKDERTREVKSWQLLEKTYLCRIIKDNEVAEFISGLEEHQRTSEKGDNILRQVLIEHNLLAASRVYTNISMALLSTLLGVTEDQAEDVASTMISSGRLSATIDQIERVVIFAGTSAISRWDKHIANFCEQLTKIYEEIQAAHPEFVAEVEGRS